jgi:hypothetical protein
MFAHLPSHVRDYSIIQVAVSNGSKVPWVVKVQDFAIERGDGTKVVAAQPRAVINELLQKAGRTEVIRLVGTYEMGLYGLGRIQSTNGYEQRRQAAAAELTSAKIKAAAAASAIAFVDTKLMPGQTTDGAIFYPGASKGMGQGGRLTVRMAGEVFEFQSETAAP